MTRDDQPPPIQWWGFKRRIPSPLEVATADYVQAQHDRLAACRQQERANADVLMVEGRLERLRQQIRELSAEASKA